MTITSIPSTQAHPGPKLMTPDTALRFGGQKYIEPKTGNSEVDRLVGNLVGLNGRSGLHGDRSLPPAPLPGAFPFFPHLEPL